MNNHGSAFPKDTNLLENGGHLISLSEDGTIAVTNLNSGEIIKNLHNFAPSDKDKNRINQFFEEASANRRHKRRNSFSSYFSVNHFYEMAKVKS